MFHLIVAADQWFENVMLAVRTPFLLQAFNWITVFGNTSTIIAATGVALIFLWFFTHHKAYAIGLATSIIGAGVMGYIVKMIVERPRPGGFIPSTIETSFSFPSEHATLAIALYGFLTYLLCKRFPKNASAIMTMAALAILAVGFSRLYLGVHFPSDVIAGYLLGGLWLLIGIEIAALLKRDGIVR